MGTNKNSDCIVKRFFSFTANLFSDSGLSILYLCNEYSYIGFGNNFGADNKL